MTRPAHRSALCALAALPEPFSYTQGRAAGVSDRRLYGLRDAGLIEQMGRGLFRLVDTASDADPDLLEITHRAPAATLCLTTALARHGLTDAIPSRIDVALPRGHRYPSTQVPVSWHAFAVKTFGIGRESLTLTDGVTIGLYGPERSIIDVFRLRHIEGQEVGVEAVRRWLLRRGAQPSHLLAMAQSFPKAQPAVRSTLEILL